LLDRAEKTIFNIGQRALTQTFTPIKDILPETFERIDMLSKHKGSLRGIATGFKSIDLKLSGLQKSDVIILAARPGMGKTALALNIAKNAAVGSQKVVGIFSLEMAKDQLSERLLSSVGSIDAFNLRNAKLNDDEYSRLQYAMGILSEAPLYIDDAGSVNMLQMRAMARRLQANKGLDLLIIDYLQLMQPMNKFASEVQQVTENTRALKVLAKELNIPVLVLSQLSREPEKRIPPIPKLSDLRQSGSIEQDADIVLFIYREDAYNENSLKPGQAEIIIAKHRNGPTGSVDLYFEKETSSFKNLDTSNYGLGAEVEIQLGEN